MLGNLTNIPQFDHSHTSQSQWWLCGVIIDTGFLNYFNYTTQLCCKLFLTQECVFEVLSISLKIIGTYFTKPIHQITYHSCIFAFTFYVELVTPASLWRHKGVAMHVTSKPCINFLQCTIGRRPLRIFACKFRLRITSKRIDACHNRI